jgi:predicted secreted protein
MEIRTVGNYHLRDEFCWLWAGRSGDRIPVGVRFFAHVHTGPGPHPASCTMGTGSFPGVKRSGRGADHPPPLAPWSRECRSIPLPPLWAFGSVTGYLYLYLDEFWWIVLVLVALLLGILCYVVSCCVVLCCVSSFQQSLDLTHCVVLCVLCSAVLGLLPFVLYLLYCIRLPVPVAARSKV